MKITKSDWEKVIVKCKEQYDLICNTLKDMIIAAELQEVTFEKALEKHKEAPAK